jgi:hypothetical protein
MTKVLVEYKCPRVKDIQVYLWINKYKASKPLCPYRLSNGLCKVPTAIALLSDSYEHCVFDEKDDD